MHINQPTLPATAWQLMSNLFRHGQHGALWNHTHEREIHSHTARRTILPIKDIAVLWQQSN
jgi:hypothetical protein